MFPANVCTVMRTSNTQSSSPTLPLSVQSHLQVNLVNTNIDGLSKQHLKQHPRVMAPGGKLITKERHGGDPNAALFRECMGFDQDEDEDEEETDDDDDDEDDDGFGGGAGFGFMGGLGLLQGDGGAGTGTVPAFMMQPLMQALMGGASWYPPAGGQMMMQPVRLEEGGYVQEVGYDDEDERDSESSDGDRPGER
jgi:hypothetical protein